MSGLLYLLFKSFSKSSKFTKFHTHLKILSYFLSSAIFVIGIELFLLDRIKMVFNLVLGTEILVSKVIKSNNKFSLLLIKIGLPLYLFLRISNFYSWNLVLVVQSFLWYIGFVANNLLVYFHFSQNKPSGSSVKKE